MPNPRKDTVNAEIARTLSDMKNHAQNSDEYKELMATLERLVEMKTKTGPKPMNRDNLVVGAMNLLGIGALIMFEKSNVITTKAFGLIGRKP